MTGDSRATRCGATCPGWPAGWASRSVRDEPVYPAAAGHVPGGAAGGDERESDVPSRRARLAGLGRRPAGQRGLAGRPAGHHRGCAVSAMLDRPERIGAEREENAPVMPERPADPAGPGRPRRRVSLPALAWRQFRRAPVTVYFLAAVWAAGLGSGTIAHGPSRWLSAHAGAGLPSLGHGYWWTPLSAGLWASGLGGYLAVTVLGLLVLAPAERRMGVTRTFATLLASQAAGLLLAAGLIKLAGLAREPWLSALTGETAVGALPGVLGVGFVLSRTLSPLWRRRLRLLLTAAVTISALYLGHLEQVAQACGAAAGVVTMALLYGRARPGAR